MHNTSGRQGRTEEAKAELHFSQRGEIARHPLPRGDALQEVHVLVPVGPPLRRTIFNNVRNDVSKRGNGIHLITIIEFNVVPSNESVHICRSTSFQMAKQYIHCRSAQLCVGLQPLLRLLLQGRPVVEDPGALPDLRDRAHCLVTWSPLPLAAPFPALASPEPAVSCAPTHTGRWMVLGQLFTHLTRTFFSLYVIT